MEQYKEYNNNDNSPIRDSHKSFEEKILEAIDDYENGRFSPFDEVMRELDEEFNIEV